jgi:cytochrome b involved in lipid metabolism
VVGYIVNHYCLAFVRGVVHDVVGYIVNHYCLAFVREVVHDVVGYIVTTSLTNAKQ